MNIEFTYERNVMVITHQPATTGFNVRLPLKALVKKPNRLPACKIRDTGQPVLGSVGCHGAEGWSHKGVVENSLVRIPATPPQAFNTPNSPISFSHPVTFATKNRSYQSSGTLESLIYKDKADASEFMLPVMHYCCGEGGKKVNLWSTYDSMASRKTKNKVL